MSRFYFLSLMHLILEAAPAVVLNKGDRAERRLGFQARAGERLDGASALQRQTAGPACHLEGVPDDHGRSLLADFKVQLPRWHLEKFRQGLAIALPVRRRARVVEQELPAEGVV